VGISEWSGCEAGGASEWEAQRRKDSDEVCAVLEDSLGVSLGARLVVWLSGHCAESYQSSVLRSPSLADVQEDFDSGSPESQGNPYSRRHLAVVKDSGGKRLRSRDRGSRSSSRTSQAKTESQSSRG